MARRHLDEIGPSRRTRPDPRSAVTEPRFVVLSGSVFLSGALVSGKEELRCELHCSLYVRAPMGSSIVLPDHLCTAVIVSADSRYPFELSMDAAKFTLPRVYPDSQQAMIGGGRSYPISELHTVSQGDQQVIVTGPGKVYVAGYESFDRAFDASLLGPVGELELSIAYEAIGADRSGVVALRLNQVKAAHSGVRWQTT